MRVGPGYIATGTRQRVLRCGQACSEGRRIQGVVEGCWDSNVRSPCFNSFQKYRLIEFLFRSLIGVPSSTLYMVTYDHLLHSAFPLFITPSASTPLFAGIAARTFISTIVSPLELIRINLQSTPLSSSNPNTLRSVVSSVANLVRKQGSMSLWKGLGASLWRDVPFSGLYWANYEGLKSWFNRNGREGTSVAFASGAMSGIVAALVTSPFDVLKTRRQALIMSTPSHTTATIPLLRRMVQTEGYSVLYTGIGPRMAKIAPACGIMIACYEVCIHFSPSVSDSF